MRGPPFPRPDGCQIVGCLHQPGSPATCATLVLPPQTLRRASHRSICSHRVPQSFPTITGYFVGSGNLIETGIATQRRAATKFYHSRNVRAHARAHACTKTWSRAREHRIIDAPLHCVRHLDNAMGQRRQHGQQPPRRLRGEHLLGAAPGAAAHRLGAHRQCPLHQAVLLPQVCQLIGNRLLRDLHAPVGHLQGT